MKTAKRIGSILLVLIMVLSLFPSTAFAETGVPVGPVDNPSVSLTADSSPYTGEPAAAPAAAQLVNGTQDTYAFTTQPSVGYPSALDDGRNFYLGWTTSFVPTKVEIGWKSSLDGTWYLEKAITNGLFRQMANVPLPLDKAKKFNMYVRAYYSTDAYIESSAFSPDWSGVGFTTQPTVGYPSALDDGRNFYLGWTTSFVPTKVEIGWKSSLDDTWYLEKAITSGLFRQMANVPLPLDMAKKFNMYVRAYYSTDAYIESSAFSPDWSGVGFTTQPSGILYAFQEYYRLTWKTSYVPTRVEIGWKSSSDGTWYAEEVITTDLNREMVYNLPQDQAKIFDMYVRTYYGDGYVDSKAFQLGSPAFTSQPTGGTMAPESTLTLKWSTNFMPTAVEIGYMAGSSWVTVDTVTGFFSESMSRSLAYDDVNSTMRVRVWYNSRNYVESTPFTITIIPRQFTASPADGTINPGGTMTVSWGTNFTPERVQIGTLSGSSFRPILTITDGLTRSMSRNLSYDEAVEGEMIVRAWFSDVSYVTSAAFTVTKVPRQFTAQPTGGTVYPWRGLQLSWTTNFVPVKVVLGYGSETRWTGKVTLTDGLQKSMNHSLSYDEAENSMAWSVRAYYGTGTGDYVASSAFPITKKDAYVCGDNLTAALSDDGTLTFSGTGAMYNYSATNHAPWFDMRSAIKKVVISDGVTYIGTYAFHLCSNLTTVSFTPSVTQVGSNAVYDCTSLRWVKYDGFKSQWAQITWNYGNAGLQDASLSCLVRTGTLNGTNITWGIYGDQNLLEIDGWGEIPGHMQMPWYEYGDFIELVKIWNGIEKIGEENFRGCTAMKTIYLPGSLTWVDDMAFSECTQLRDVYFDGPISDWNQITIRPYNDPLTNASLHTAAVSHYLTDDLAWSVDDAGLLRIFVTDEFMGSGDQTAMPNYTTYTQAPWYADYAETITAVRVERGVTSIGNQAFGHLSYLRSLEVGNTVLRIGDKAFSACRRLEDFTLPDSVKTIGTQAFSDCSYLELLHLPDSITMISSGAFAACSNLEKVWLPNGIVGINDSIFLNCGLLDEIYIPASVKSIAQNAFYGCTELTDSYSHVYYGGTSAQWKAVSINATGNTPLLNAGNMHFTPPELAVNAVNFPDAQFRAYVASNFDTDGSGYLTDAERNDAADINDEDNDYGSLQGIEYFPNLTGILIDAAPSLISVDLSGNPELSYVDFSGDENLSEINLNGLTELLGLYVSSTAVAELDLSGLSALRSLSVSSTPITALDLRPIALRDLYCSNTGITALDLSGQSDLYRLYCYGTGITVLDLSDCPLLLEVLRDGKRTEKTMSGVPYVEYALSGTNHVLAVDADTVLIGMDELPIDAAHFPDADFRASVAWDFDLNGNGWLSGTEIAAATSACWEEDHDIRSVQGIEYLTELENLVLDSNRNLTSMDLRANTKLQHVEVWDNGLTELRLDGLTRLSVVSCDGNQLRYLDVSSSQLTELYTYGNPMGALILGDQPNLKRLDCYGTGGSMKTLDIRDCPYLLDAYLNGTKTVPDWGDQYDGPLGGKLQLDAATEVLTPGCISVDVTHFPDYNFREYIAENFDTNLTQWLTPEEIAAVNVIDVQNKNIASVTGIEYFPALQSLTTLGNPIQSLDLSGNPNLKALYCTSSQLTELDLSHTPDLEVLSCLGNSITSLDLTPTPRLVEAVEEGTREEFTDEGYNGWLYRRDPYRLLVDKGVELIGAVWQPEYDGVLPAAMKTLEEEALAGCAFQAVRIPDGAVKIGSRAFAGSPNLEYVYIPESVTEIAADAFYDVPAGLMIIGVAGSLAESFASAHGFMFAAA